MVRIQLKRVYEAYDKSDGLRVLVDRLWPRGMKKEALHYDLWEKGITPSSELRKWVHADKDGRWAEFIAAYEQELNQSEVFKHFVEKIKDQNIVTLLYATKDEKQNHAFILKMLLEKNLM